MAVQPDPRASAPRVPPRALPAQQPGPVGRAEKARQALSAWREAASGRVESLPVLGRAWSFVEGVTRLGWAVACFGALAAPAGWWLGWLELLILGILALACMVLALLLAVGRASYEVRLRLLKDRVTVGSRATGTLQVINRSGRAVRSSLMDLPFGQGIASFRVPGLSSGGQHIEGFELPTERRGVITIGPAEAVRGDPLGLVRRTTVWDETIELYIHPQIVPLSSKAVGFIRDVEGATVNQLSSSDVSFHALRDFTLGDDRRNIHWPTTIRVGKLMVRQFEETRRAHLLVVLDRSVEAWEDEEDFEVGLSAAASLAAASLRDGKEATVVCQDSSCFPSSAMRAMDYFAALEQAEGVSDLVAVTKDALLEAPEASVVVAITGANNPIDVVHRALATLPLNVAKAALRVDANSALSVRTVDGFPVVTFPDRDELPRALKRALQ